MPNTKISADPAVTVLNGADIIPIVQSATNKIVSISDFIELLDLARYGRTSTVIDRLIDFNGDTVSGNTEVDSWADLVATYPAASNTGMSVLVKNAGDNTIGVPCTAWSNGVEWLIIGGDTMLTTTTPKMKLLSPAATFTPGAGYTLTQGATPQETIIASTGVHGFTTGAPSGTPQYIPITANTGGSVPWTVGLYKITNVPNTTSITVLRDYVAGAGVMGNPTIALAGTEFEVLRVHLPPLTDTGAARWLICTENSTSVNTKETRVRFGAAGVAMASATELATHTDITGTTLVGIGGLFNYGGVTNTNSTISNIAQLTTGSATGNPVNSSIQTNVTTDLIVTMLIATANEFIELRKATFWWNP